jgi:coenzyme F420 hydrogenase subunit beta
MQCLGILPAHIITFAIGLFCIENLQFDQTGRLKLEAKLRSRVGYAARFEDIDKLNVKEDMIVSLNDGTTVRVPLDELEDMARPACLVCTDFANDYADLSAGGLGSPSGYTTILIRTPLGNRIYGGAASRGYIEERNLGGWAATRSEQAQMIDQVIAFAQRKRTRGEARLEMARHSDGA